MRCSILGLTSSLAMLSSMALAQEAAKPIDANDLVAILDPRSGPAFQADQIAAILHPAEGGGSPREAGSWGSGVLPDLHVRFEPGSAKLAPTADAQLRELAAALNGDLLEPFRFQIRGHTDASGADDANTRLAKARAEAVVTHLRTENGVAGGRLLAVGVGERELALPNEPESAMNRRVEIRTLDSARN